MKHAASDDLWRVGLLEEAQKRGVDESYRVWTELLAIGGSSDNETALCQLTELLESSTDCFRDQVLELLLEFQRRVGNEEAQQALAQELVDHRSTSSPPSRRPLDLANLGVVSSKRGDLQAARAAFKEARSVFNLLLTPLARAQFWLKAGIFSNDYDKDFATALHSFRIAAEECAVANDLVSMAYAFEEISSVYRSLDRVRLAEVYAVLAQRTIAPAASDQNGIAGSFADVSRWIEKGVALTEFLLEDYESTAERAQYLLNDPSLPAEERVSIERLALACAVESHHWRLARKIAKSWLANGQRDLAVVAGATIALLKDSDTDEDNSFDPAQSADFAGVGKALRSLGASASGVEGLLRPSTRSSIGRALVHTLANVIRADPILPTRLMGDFEAAAWVTQSERGSAVTAQAAIQRGGVPTSLPPAAPWSAIIARYDLLGVWELPDLAIMGPILDSWALMSRFEQAVRINPVPPCDGSLNLYFYRIDPEGHLGVNTCAYIPEGDLIICSLRYLDDLTRLRRNQWQKEFDNIKSGLVRIGWESPDEVAQSLANKVRARERVLLEWVISHEIGHAHFSPSQESQGNAQAAEEQADSFFIDGMTRDGGVAELLHAIYGQLDMLYWYDCEKQTKRAVSEEERRDRSVKLDPAADVSGHRPLTFRAVDLVRSILKIHPDLESDTYIEQFAASILAH